MRGGWQQRENAVVRGLGRYRGLIPARSRRWFLEPQGVIVVNTTGSVTTTLRNQTNT